jgi:DNA-damage-inducible protein J
MNVVDLRLKVSSEVKQDAEAVFNDMGMSIGDAVRIFLKQSVNSGGLPFKPHIKTPNHETIMSFSEIENNNYDELSLEEFKNALNTN